MSKNEMLTVPLTSAQRGFVKRVAEAESTSEAAVVRRLVAEAARRVVDEDARAPPPPSKPWAPEHERVERTPASIAKGRERLAQIKAAAGPYWLDRYHHLEQEIELAERFLPAPANGGA